MANSSGSDRSNSNSRSRSRSSRRSDSDRRSRGDRSRRGRKRKAGRSRSKSSGKSNSSRGRSRSDERNTKGRSAAAGETLDAAQPGPQEGGRGSERETGVGEGGAGAVSALAPHSGEAAATEHPCAGEEAAAERLGDSKAAAEVAPTTKPPAEEESQGSQAPARRPLLHAPEPKAGAANAQATDLGGAPLQATKAAPGKPGETPSSNQSSPSSAATPSLIYNPLQKAKMAAAFRTKYRKHDESVHLPPWMLGAHPFNRNKIGLNGERCEQLFVDVFQRYDRSEANHDCVCVEEKPGGNAIFVHNKESISRSMGKLAALTVEKIDYGTIGHSHVNQLLKNIPGRAIATHKDAEQAVDSDGRLNISLVRALDPPLAEDCMSGLRWEVLSWRMEEEEPEAVSYIQSFLNEKNNVAMVEHEMQALSCLANLCSRATSGGGSLNLAAIEVGVRNAGWSALADFAQFKNVFELVIDLGADNGPHMED